MGKQSTRNPRKFESHGNYQPYGIPKISKDHKHLQQHKFKAIYNGTCGDYNILRMYNLKTN